VAAFCQFCHKQIIGLLAYAAYKGDDVIGLHGGTMIRYRTNVKRTQQTKFPDMYLLTSNHLKYHVALA
jgi:hypothetical protein